MVDALTFDDYLAIAKRRIWLMLGVAVVLLLVSVLVINNLTPLYRSTATVSVESRQVPQEFVQSTVVGNADERVGFIQRRLMTSAKLLEIIDRLGLYADRSEETSDAALVEGFRKHILLEPIQERRNIVAFTLSFEHRDPEVAAVVATELIETFLRENVTTRTARASETTDFLRREAARLSQQVSAMEEKVAAFKQEHREVLPEHQGLRMDMLRSSESGLKALEREIIGLEGDMRLMETQLATLDAAPVGTSSADRPALSPAQQLAALKVELIEKTAIYAPSHPDLKWLKRTIAQLERAVKATPAGQVPAGADPVQTRIESQIVSANARLASLRSEREELRNKIEALQAQVIATPQVEREFQDLTRDYENALAEYEEIKSKQRDAELAENLEAQETADRFVVLEAPQVPTSPTWPDKPKLYLMGFAAALGGGGGTAFLAELLDATIRGPAMLASILQRHPLAVIPFIESSADRRRGRERRKLSLIVAVVLLVALVAVIHFVFYPLDALVASLGETLAHL